MSSNKTRLLGASRKLGEDFHEEGMRDACPTDSALESLCTGPCSTWCTLMAITIGSAQPSRPPPCRVGPNISRLHAHVSVLAIRDGATRILGQKGKGAEHAARVLDEPPTWRGLIDECESFADDL